MAVPMNSAQFRATVAPILNKTFDGVYEQRADEWKQVFKERKGIERAYHEEPVLYGMNMAPELPEGMPVSYDSGGTLYIKRYLYKVYGLAFALTKVLVEDGDHIQIGQTYSRQLAQSLIETKETLCANILNRSFNGAYAGGDGVALISASHPSASVGLQSNRLTTDANLSQTSLEQMLIQIRNAADPNGKRIRLIPGQIVTGPSNVFQAEVLLKSALRAGTANNDINPVNSMGLLKGGQANISRVTSTTAWWVQTHTEMGLQMMTRRKLEKSMEGDFETDSMRYKSTERYAPGWTQWLDLYGTPGL
jgi:hypothetical protein